MNGTIEIAEISVEVIIKDIKHVHLGVYPPNGRVRLSAPRGMDIDTIRLFAISKLGWIRQQQKKFYEQIRETPREYLTRESHYLWGKRYLLEVVESDTPPILELKHKTMLMLVRPGTDQDRKQTILAKWYREQIRIAVLPLLEKWEPALDVKVEKVFVQHMKTRWGSCNSRTHNIRLNTELAKKPRECLEYIVVHEMVHLLAPTHSQVFTILMDRFMPKWRYYRDTLNRLPVCYERWKY